ncbi:MAG: class I SAM-dependent methyltransferase [Actinomycetota bacterium]
MRDFVVAMLPPTPARVLEVGCGAGKLARALARAGFRVTAIDPEAPEDPIFQRVLLEDFAAEVPFDAAVASLALHHVHDLRAALEKIVGLLEPGGMLVLNEFAKDQLDEPTARWYFHERHALAAAFGRDPPPASFDDWWMAWRDDHAGIHDSEAMRTELDRLFERRLFVWTPYLCRYELDAALEPLERSLIDAGAIRATGFRYAGIRH